MQQILVMFKTIIFAIFHQKKSCVWETLNLLMCADISTDEEKNPKIFVKQNIKTLIQNEGLTVCGPQGPLTHNIFFIQEEGLVFVDLKGL